MIAPLTVKKAYDELERVGYIETRRGQGTFVTDRSPSAAHRRAASDHLREAIRHAVNEARLLRLSRDELVDEVSREFERSERSIPRPSEVEELK